MPTSRGAPLVGILGAGTVFWLLSHSTRVEFSAVGGTLAVAILYFFLRRRNLSRRSVLATQEAV